MYTATVPCPNLKEYHSQYFHLFIHPNMETSLDDHGVMEGRQLHVRNINVLQYVPGNLMNKKNINSINNLVHNIL